MSNENPNNTPHWRNKLDELEHLPGEGFNGEVAWDKLYGRLRGKKTNKKILWYWMAAACLLFALIIGLMNERRSISQPAEKQTVKSQPKETKQPALNVKEIDKTEQVNSAEVIKDKVVTISNKRTQRNHRVIATQLSMIAPSSADVMSDPEQEPAAMPLQIIKNPATAAVSPKKRLSVVHINELGDPVMETSDLTRIADMHAFQLKFGNGEVLSNSPIASKSSGLIILKTKPPSN